MLRRVFLRVLLGVSLGLSVLCGADARADTYPSRPIRVIIPFGSGSATDVVPRLVLEELSRRLGQQIIVENRSGEGGTIGAMGIAKADPDGYQLLVTSAAHTMAPSIYPSLPYDTAYDFAAVGAIGHMPNVLVIASAKGFKTPKELVAAAKPKPGSVKFASVGAGSVAHLAAERFRIAAGYQATHTPFSLGMDALADVTAGRVDYYFCPITNALPQIRDGKLRALAVASRTRASLLPDVPTTLEAGFPDSDYTFWIGMFAPAKTPPAIIEKLNRELAAAVAAPAVREKLAGYGVDAMPLSVAQFDALVKSELTRNATFAKTIGLKPN
jgi:tripartite-type tricarboxylate transporter receptor subunit TctC